MTPGRWVARILQETTGERFVPSRDGLFQNNVVVLRVDALGSFVNVGPDTAPDTFVFRANLWWALDRDAAWAGPDLGGQIPAERGAVVQVDPELEGPDRRPAATSPVWGAGAPLRFPSPPDRDGVCFADPPAIGAYARSR